MCTILCCVALHVHFLKCFSFFRKAWDHKFLRLSEAPNVKSQGQRTKGRARRTKRQLSEPPDLIAFGPQRKRLAEPKGTDRSASAKAGPDRSVSAKAGLASSRNAPAGFDTLHCKALLTRTVTCS